MTLKFIVHGIEVTATNAEEAAKLIKALAGETAPSPLRQRERVERPRETRASKLRRVRLFVLTTATVRFLETIKQAGNSGIRAETLMEPLRADHPKGIGSRVAKINEYLGKLGFDPEQVYSNPRTAEGRLWTPGPKLDAALEAAKKAVR
jgi:hypothetical protein